MIRITKTIAAAGACMLLAACDVKDPIFNTPHPDHGMVTLTTEWSAIGEGLTAPESYRVEAGLRGSDNPAAGYSAVLTGVTNKLDHLFAPGDYRFRVYNTPEGIDVSGPVATVAPVAGPADMPGLYIHGNPGWLFTCVFDAAITADTEHALTAPMRQQVRQLTLLMDVKGDAAEWIASIKGCISGVAGAYDFENNLYTVPSYVLLEFSKIESGADAGKWEATVHLLGVVGERQDLTCSFRFIDNPDGGAFIGSDLTEALATFNTDKHKPLTLGSSVDTPDRAGFTATIDDWEVITREPVVAE